MTKMADNCRIRLHLDMVKMATNEQTFLACQMCVNIKQELTSIAVDADRTNCVSLHLNPKRLLPKPSISLSLLPCFLHLVLSILGRLWNQSLVQSTTYCRNVASEIIGIVNRVKLIFKRLIDHFLSVSKKKAGTITNSRV